MVIELWPHPAKHGCIYLFLTSISAAAIELPAGVQDHRTVAYLTELWWYEKVRNPDISL
jgi:uncharacterized protein YpmS